MSSILSAVALLVVLQMAPMVSGCCFPLQYQANQRLVRATLKYGHLSVVQGTLHYWYDGVSRRENFVEDLEVDGNPTTIRVINDYNVTMTKYVITSTHCTKSSLISSSFKQGCISATASTTEDSYFGMFPGDMKFSTYNTSAGSVTSFITTSSSSCVPVFDVSVVPTGSAPTMTAVQFYNFTTGIDDQSVFDIPASCQTVPSVG